MLIEDLGADEQRQALHDQRAGRVVCRHFPAQRLRKAGEGGIAHGEGLARCGRGTLHWQEQRDAGRGKAIPVLMLFAGRPEEGGRIIDRHAAAPEASIEAEAQRNNDARLRVVVRAHAAAREVDAAAESEATRMSARLCRTRAAACECLHGSVLCRFGLGLGHEKRAERHQRGQRDEEGQMVPNGKTAPEVDVIRHEEGQQHQAQDPGREPVLRRQDTHQCAGRERGERADREARDFHAQREYHRWLRMRIAGQPQPQTPVEDRHDHNPCHETRQDSRNRSPHDTAPVIISLCIIVELNYEGKIADPRRVHRGDFHPYEIKRRLENAMVECYIDVDVGTLYYAIRQLEKEGLISAVSHERVARGGMRTIYRIGAKGKAEFRELLHRQFEEEGPVSQTLYGALLFLHLSDLATVEDLVRRRSRASLDELIAKLSPIRKQLAPVISTGGEHLLRHLEKQRRLIGIG